MICTKYKQWSNNGKRKVVCAKYVERCNLTARVNILTRSQLLSGTRITTTKVSACLFHWRDSNDDMRAGRRQGSLPIYSLSSPYRLAKVQLTRQAELFAQRKFTLCGHWKDMLTCARVPVVISLRNGLDPNSQGHWLACEHCPQESLALAWSCNIRQQKVFLIELLIYLFFCILNFVIWILASASEVGCDSEVDLKRIKIGLILFASVEISLKRRDSVGDVML